MTVPFLPLAYLILYLFFGYKHIQELTQLFLSSGVIYRLDPTPEIILCTYLFLLLRFKFLSTKETNCDGFTL